MHDLATTDVPDLDDLYDLRDAPASCGGKAVGLARLIAAGLPVPAGFAISARVFARFAAGQPIELDFTDRLRAVTGGSEGDLVVVRSSAAIEDGTAGAAAGIFLSEVAVPATPDAVWTAIRSVWSSALTPHAVAYASSRTHEVALGVIIQRYIAGERITVYTRPPDGGDELLIQRGEHLARVARTAEGHADREVAALALRAEAVLGVAADVELVHASAAGVATALWVVQARPIVVRPRALFTPPPPIVLAPMQDGRTWTWDLTHNPDPLSPAQAGLVELVEQDGAGAYELRMCAGYLYTAPRAIARPHFTDEPTEALLDQCFALERELDQLLSDPPTQLAPALALYRQLHARWSSELSPRISTLRARVGAGGKRPSSIEATLAAAVRNEIDFAELVRRIGPLAATWDVAVPTFAETPDLLRRALGTVPTWPTVPAQHLDSSGASGDEPNLPSRVADLAERDDLLFARAQAMARAALRAHADALDIDRDDIYWVPLDDLLGDRAPLDRDTAKRKASAARAAAKRASRWQMPLVIGGPLAEPGAPLRGVGHGPRVGGRVVRFASLANATFAQRGDIVVVRAVTPALAVFVGHCAALVSETGGLLDHGAALARELGITCVVGCHDAWTSLTEGELVQVDGDAGTVTREARHGPQSSS